MEKSIEAFINSLDNGLYLIDMPTGTGKTTQAINYIYNHYKENRKFIYVTSLKKNVEDAYIKLNELFKKNHLEEEFKSRALRLYANADKVIESIMNVKTNTSDEIMNFQSFIRLKKEVEILKRIEKIDPNMKERFEKDIKEKLEPEFRKDVKKFINEKKRTNKERFYYIKNNHNWLLELYPSILTNNRNIYFVTIDKFYLGNDTIIESTYKFINNQSIINNAVIFIDEVDATKSTILSRQIDESLKNSIDLIQLFLNIHSTLNNKDFPKEMLIPSQLDISKQRTEESIIEKMKDVFNEAFKDNNMNYAFKLLDKDDDKKYIFDDNSILTITKEPKTTDIYIVHSNKENYNRITLTGEKNAHRLQSIIRKISGAVSYFINGCYILAINYCNAYNESQKENDLMQIDDSVSSIIRAFNINERFINYLTNVVLSKGTNKFVNVAGLTTDFYEHGFRYYKFTDSLSNNFSTVISMFDLNDTPELFLLNLCKKAHVIGLSATSTIDTVTGNYDLRFLKQKLGANYYVENDKDKDRVNAYIEKIISSNKSNITVEFEDVEDVNSSICQIFQKNDYQDYFNNLLTLQKDDEFNNRRFVKILLAIKSFILRKLPSMLILCNRNLSNSSDLLYSKKTFEKAIDFITKESKINEQYIIINLLTKGFEESKKEYQSYIKEGKKIIVFSSYPTTGAGQNLQYQYEQDGITISEDLSSIYIEKPTNMLINTSSFSENTNSDLIKYIYQVEALNNNGEITIKDKNICIKESFLRIHNSDSNWKHSNLYECNSIKNQALSVLMQAVGRICRVRGKSIDTTIFVDKDIINELDLTSIQYRKLNREFKEIINKAQESGVTKPNRDNLSIDIQKAENDNKIINDSIHYMLGNNFWNENDIDIWVNLREQALKYPCTDSYFGENNRFFDCYFKTSDKLFNKYYYNQTSDFGCAKISLSKTSEITSEVSQEDCNLSKLMKIDFIRNKFIEKGYATEFKQSGYMMLPVVYNNIYKGALGEAIGRIILEHIGYNLEDIKDGYVFEKFDYKYKNIYIDFKLWNNTGESLNVNKAQNKIDEINANHAIIINIMGNSKENVKRKNSVFVIPALIDKNELTLNEKAVKCLVKLLGEIK
ncbi:MAG: hypothetical protein K5765_02220 [Clostridia bacterium]|nr:hypothetical protein [Clostridia bacterium]